MPVAKLSREFYERFGDKVTDELVNCLNTIESGYRAELKDLFETHFGRFEAHLEQRVTEATAALAAELRAEFRAEVKEEGRSLRQEIRSLRQGVGEDINSLRNDDMRSLRQEIGEDISSLRNEDIHSLRQEVGEHIISLRDNVGQLRREIRDVRADLIKWAFTFWVPVVLALIGLYIK